MSKYKPLISILGAALILIIGFGSIWLTPNTPTPTESRHVLPVGVKEFTLKDGTRCVKLGSAAITCEWKR